MRNKSEDGAGSGRDIARYVKHYLIISLLISMIVHFLLKIEPFPVRNFIDKYLQTDGRGDGVLRALMYFFLMYTFVIPSFAVFFHRKLSGYKVPAHNIMEKIAYTVFCVILLSAMCIFPFLFLLTDNTSRGYAGFVYKSMTGSLVGLSVIGAGFSYAVTLCFWLLLFAVPKMWIGNKTKEI